MKAISVLLFFICIGFSLSAILKDQIVAVPGLTPQPKYRSYSGYMLVNETHGRYLHYYFVESQSNPTRDPVLFWTNGGPGCSSMGGFLTEHGPFLNDNDGNVHENNYSWNKIVNMIFLEHPAGVGYSYTNTSADMDRYNDNIVAEDVNSFLRQWFAGFPEFQQNEFYVSGESYAGHYVPAITERVHDGNMKGESPKINLKGFLIGNGISDAESDDNSVPFFLAGNQIVPTSEYQDGLVKCKGNFHKYANLPECAAALNKMQSRLNGYDPYDIYDQCFSDPFMMRSTKAQTLENSAPKRRFEFRQRLEKAAKRHNTHPLFALNKITLTPYIAPCVSIGSTEKYMNRADVKKAFHVRSDLKWEDCNMRINEGYDWTFETVLPKYDKLSKAGYRLVHYSGDVDVAVNGLGTQESMRKFAETTGQRVVKQWGPWYGEDNLIAGQWIKYERVSYLTVRGAGHMVPTNRPAQALLLLKKYLAGEF